MSGTSETDQKYLECQNPRCASTPEEVYTGENGNELHVCPRHYWMLVAGEDTSPTIDNRFGGRRPDFSQPVTDDLMKGTDFSELGRGGRRE